MEDLNDQACQPLTCDLIVYSKNTCKTERQLSAYVYITDDLIKWVNDAKKRKCELLHNPETESVYLSMSFGTQPLKASTPARSIDYPVVAKCSEGYIVGFQNGDYPSISFSKRDITRAKIFQTAEDALSKLPKQFGPYRFIDADNIYKAKAKNIVLSVNRNGNRVYVNSLGKRSLTFTCCKGYAEKKFLTEEEAMKWYTKYIGGRFSAISDPIAEKIKE